MFETVLIVGMGLIGGSIAKMIREKRPQSLIFGVDKDPENIHLAAKQGVLNGSFGSVEEVFGSFQLAFVCTPPETVAEIVRTLLPRVGHRCLITDTASVKKPVVEEIEGLDGEISFLGGHPMAGSERGGFAAAKTSLLENAYYVLTPCNRTPPGLLSRFRDFLASLGALPIVLEAEAHDRAVSIISHVPHVAAAALCHMLEYGDEALNRRLVAGGFRDLTRIAASDPALWGQITYLNREEVAKALDGLIEELTRFRQELGGREELSAYFSHAQELRKSLNARFAGLIPEVFELCVDVRDRVGIIAEATRVLCDAGVNIKNIHIANSREDVGGVMLIALPDRGSLKRARAALTQAGFSVTLREEKTST